MLYLPSDDSQTLPNHEADSFWNVFKLCQQGANLHIVGFSTYGYNGAWDTSASTTVVTPYSIPPKNTWGLEDVRFTKAESEDYISRFCTTYFDLEEDDTTLLQEYVVNTTAYHPGLVAYFMDKIQDHFFSDRKYGKKLTFERIFLYLKSYEFYIAIGNEARACKALYHLTDEEAKVCDMVFHGVSSRIPLQSREALRLLKTGLLSVQNEQLDFTAPYLRVLYLQQRYGSSLRAKKPPEDFKAFLKGTFTIMDANTIRNSSSVGTDGRILERLWQMEFYRAATSLLPYDVHISPDVGARWGSRGYLDFWVDDDRCWAIELLRDGSDAPGHKHRFEDGGIYARIKKRTKEWAIIDIRNPGLSNKRPAYNGGNWVNVYCQENWDSVIIDYGEGEQTSVCLMGGQVG